MGTKLVLNDITDIFAQNTASLISENFDAISDYIDNVVSRDGDDPSSLLANLDFNGKRGINLASPINNADAATKAYVDNVAGGGGGGGSGSTALGTTYLTGLTFDGVTDQSSALNEAIEDAEPGSTIVVVSPDGGALRLNRSVIVDKTLTLDLSTTPIDIGGTDNLGQGQFVIQGSVSEVTPAFQLAANVSAGATQVTLNDSPTGIDITDITVGSVLNIRGQNDASGSALQSDKNRIVTAVDNVNKIVTFEPALENSYQTTYPTSDWVPSGDTVDRTLVSLVRAYPLTANAASKVKEVTISTANAALLTVGQTIALFNSRIASDVAGASANLIDRELFIIKDINTGTGVVELNARTKRAFNTADKSYIEVIEPVKNACIIGPSNITINSVDSQNREPVCTIKQAHNCSVFNFKLNNIGNTVSPRGPMVRFEDAIGCNAYNTARLEDDESLATSGDLYGITFAIGSMGCSVDGLFTMGCRHGFSFFQATGCLVNNHIGIGDLINSGDFHGLNSYNCVLSNFIYQGHDGATPDASDTHGVVVSNTFHNAGDFNAVIINGVITGFNKPSESAVRILAPSDNVVVSNVHVKDCHFGVLLKGEETVDGGRVTVLNSTFMDLTAEAIYDGTNAGSNFATGCIIQGIITDGTRTGTDSSSTTITDRDTISHTAVNYTSAGVDIEQHIAGIDTALATLTAGGSTWGSITGTLSTQTDLQNALNAKANTSHTHTVSDITDAGELASEDDAPADGTNYVRKDNAWASLGAPGSVDWANVNNKPDWTVNPNTREIDTSSSVITITQTDINEGVWHFVNSSTGSVTISFPAGLTFPADKVTSISFYCAGYSNPVTISVDASYTNGLNASTITAVGDIYTVLAINFSGVTTLRAIKGSVE